MAAEAAQLLQSQDDDMSLMKQKQIRVAGVEVTAAVEAARAERIKQSVWWRYLGRPSLGLLGRVGNKQARRVSSQPKMHTRTWTVTGNGNGKAAAALVPDTPEAAALREKIAGRYWYHTLDFGHGVVTPGFVDNRDQVNKIGLPDDLSGRRCADIGTFDGFWAFEMERRGAEEVIAIDLDSLEQMDIRPAARERFIEEAIRVRGTARLGETFALAREILDSKVQRTICNLYELSPDKTGGKFDVVHCSDVIPHIRDPQLAIENIFSVTRGFAILGSAFDPELDQLKQPLMRVCPTGGDFVWWWYSASSLKLMMELAGFERVEEVSRIRVDNGAGDFWKVFLKGYAPA
jgi:tRNA (mo5U34)-methyltransferase